MAEPRPFTVAEALAHVEAPRDAVAWAESFDRDLAAAWLACPRASWLVCLALTARVPFAPVLAAVAAAHELRRRLVPLDEVTAELRALGVEVDDPNDGGLDVLRELVARPTFADEERYHFGYGDGFFEQAYATAQGELDAIEDLLVARGGLSADRARAELVGVVHAHVTLEELMRSHRRCIANGHGGLEINR